MITNTRITCHFRVMINIIILIITFGCQSAPAYNCWSCSKEENQAIQDLIRSAKVDSYNNITTYLHTADEVELLLNALDNKSLQVKRTSLEILRDLFRQSNISQQMALNLVIPALKNFIHLCSTEDTLNFRVEAILNSGRIALWCAEQYVLNEEDKNRALMGVVDGSAKDLGVDLRPIALDMLSDCNSNCENVIEDLLRIKEMRENQGFREQASRIQYCIKIIRNRESLLQIDETQKITYLNDLFKENAYNNQGWGAKEFGLWLITKIKLIGGNSAILSLKYIWNNESLDSVYRAAAQEALIYLNAIKPEERTIFYD